MTDTNRVEAWGFDLRRAALAYDRRCSARERLPNPHRIALILERIEKAQDMVRAGKTVRFALCDCFNDRLLGALLRASGQAAPTAREAHGHGQELPG